MCDEKIYSLKDGNLNSISEISEENITFAGIKLSKSIFRIVEQVNGINNQNTNVEIKNTSNNNSYLYIINGIAKEVYSQDGVIAVNLGSEVYFVSENGWLMKKYVSQQEINNVVISDKIVGIIYRNKIEIIEL